VNIGFDVDGTIDAFPREIQSMMSAFHAAGFHNIIITGIEGSQVTQADIDAKREYLTGLGISRDLYDDLIVCPDPHPQNKLKAVTDNEVGVLFDNDVNNAKAVKNYCAVFLLYNAKTK
jgi:hypothetical protein